MRPVMLFHGTRKPFTVGGLVIPRSQHGGPGTTAPVNPGQTIPEDAGDWVYATENLDLAWVYAWAAPGRGAPKVLVISAIGALEQDPEHSGAMEAWRMEAGKVVAVHKEPTVTEADAAAGWLLEESRTVRAGVAGVGADE